jgi:hypothetical protein
MAKAAVSKGKRRPGTKGKPAPARESGHAAALRRYYQPGARERGLLIIAQGMDAADQERKIIALRTEFLQLMATREPVQTRYVPLQIVHNVLGEVKGFEAADEWSKQSGFWALNAEIAALNERAGGFAERMIALRPKTLAGITAVAATLKDYALSQYWRETKEDRDWDVEIITGFLDCLIELGQAEEALT